MIAKQHAADDPAPQETGIGLLRLKLGACMTGPTKRLAEDLHAVARLCNRARNAMARAWLRWREDNPDWQAPPALDTAGKPKLRRDGEPILLCPAHPITLPHPTEGHDITFRTWLYHAGRKAVPELAGNLVSLCAGEVLSRLTAAMPYNHQGQARRRWEAVLGNEVNLDSYRSLSIPVPNNSSGIRYTDAGRDAKLSAAVRQRLLTAGSSSCAIAFPLWSGSSGRTWTCPIVRLEVRQLSRGNRHVVRKVASGQWKFSDSELVFIEDKGWFFHLTYQQPTADLGLDKSRVAVLSAADPKGLHPFTLTDGSKTWQVGHGPLLKSAFGRLDARRRAMRQDYGVAGSGRRGHCHQRNERDKRPITRHVRHLGNRIVAQAAAEVVKFCLRFDCGTVEYREPAPQARRHTWFGKADVQWDWTLFAAKLKHQLARRGIVLRAGDARATA